MSNPPDTDAKPQGRMARALECLRVSLVLGLTSFGGPAAHIGYFEKNYVTRRGWLSAAQFAQLTALCQLLPGPASSQMNFLVGWLRAGLAGAVFSFIGFTLPSVILMLLVALYAQQLSGLPALVSAMKLVAAVIVVQAVWSMARRLCPDLPRRFVAVASTAACALMGGIYVQIAVMAAGAVATAWRPPAQAAAQDETPLPNAVSAGAAWRALRVFILLLLVLPVFSAVFGTQGVAAIADVFYRSGALVFGGGHVVLPLLHDALPALRQDMMLYYGFAQGLPGPLFSIAAALGYALLPAAPWAGAAVATGFIFLPGLLLAIAGYYFWQRILSMPRLLGALSGLSAAVVGILAGTLIDPVLTGAIHRIEDAVFIIVCFALAQWKNLPAPVVMVLCAGYVLAMGALG
ncbi:MAG TPA: chromate efflux transporter [Alphaproteobacteria bacterium]|nr:chromate efflux transporter [Alphaproteobacteria bacterium]